MNKGLIFFITFLLNFSILFAENEIQYDTLSRNDIEVIIKLPTEYKRYKFEDAYQESYGYLLRDLVILDVTFMHYPTVSIAEGDSIIWDVKVGNIARSFCIVRDQKYIRKDIYVGKCYVSFSNATEKNLPFLNSVLDNIIVRRREE